MIVKLTCYRSDGRTLSNFARNLTAVFVQNVTGGVPIIDPYPCAYVKIARPFDQITVIPVSEATPNKGEPPGGGVRTGCICDLGRPADAPVRRRLRFLDEAWERGIAIACDAVRAAVVASPPAAPRHGQ
ncbi:hypothetical protein CR155_12715 [Pollutimonas nitritireducens]|uniref:Uncharacterized protein n=1 Tax=Pollutimonas nitritireducens TaxID=2045209 RepID=A0A2N4UF62_9BURK|nr:hypothetical protein CR155_12715 [Pollutimonas nitritireducens]